MTDFKDKVVIVTGGADSVGRVTAERFHAKGAKVAIIDLNADLVAAVVDDNKGMVGVSGNVAEADAVERLFGEVLNTHGRVDVLVNAVGVSGPTASLEDVSLDDWDAVFAVNVRGMFHCMQHAARAMKAQKNGAIINYSSASTKVGLPNRTAYVASKAAVEGLTYTAARELGPFNIRCNAILPGVINNRRMQGIIERNAAAQNISPDEMEASYLKYVSMKTKIEPLELADLTLYLASDEARHLTGQMIELSGLLEWEE